ncbi:MAG: 3-dehydroquinate synthase [Moraxella sp.]|nr:3-dehydroquinate synthase [Moraxella sp.]
MSALFELTVETSQQDYPIIIDELSTPLDFDFSGHIKGNKVLIVTNDTVAPLYLEALKAALTDKTVLTCILPDGEMHKTQDSINAIYDTLMQGHFGRDCTLIALGGGVIGDMTGFAAASFMRGVDFIQVPTTLLAQVDSSVGGKTGINHALGKNMIGAFWQPVCVLADMSTLKTLPQREFSAGMAEVVKYALIMDAKFLDWLETHQADILAHKPEVLSEMVYRCCQYKADIVASDEKEQGRRALLNFGHTFGHVIETHMGYGNWLHGEAVAAGMMQALGVSVLQGRISEAEKARVAQLLTAFGLPIAPPKIDFETALNLMGHDKKVKNGKLRFVLLDAIGQAVVTDAVSLDELKAVFV